MLVTVPFKNCTGTQKLREIIFSQNQICRVISQILHIFFFSKQSDDDYISCVSWVSDGNYLAVGDSTCGIDLWDVTSSKLMRTMKSHTDRISTLKWNEHILASGSRTGDLFLHDVRIAEHLVAKLEGHTQEICGMAWSPESVR